MRRIAIIGNSGSGKSTLARTLAAEIGAVVLDLDAVAWEPGLPPRPRNPTEAVRAVRNFCAAHAVWIIEGCYGDLVESVLDEGTELIFLNIPEETCVSHCRSRPWEHRKYPSKAEQDARLEYLLGWVRDYYRRDDTMSLQAHRRIYEQHRGPKREITSVPT